MMVSSVYWTRSDAMVRTEGVFGGMIVVVVVVGVVEDGDDLDTILLSIGSG